MTGKLSPEGEVIAAYGAAMVAAFQVLINAMKRVTRSSRDSSQTRLASTWKCEEPKDRLPTCALRPPLSRLRGCQQSPAAFVEKRRATETQFAQRAAWQQHRPQTVPSSLVLHCA